MDKPLVLAYYLPQFHPFQENEEWWGKGFTEWTNVGKAKPLFKGHIQPKVPTDLGYYDLRLPVVRVQQAELAREAGVGGFCYWHYWFAPGKQLMNTIIDEVASTGKPDFPFCLGWANESWYRKLWNKDASGDKLLIEQTYGGESDYRAHYEYVRDLFKNKNYIYIDNKPFFLIYKPYNHPELEQFIQLWNRWVKEDGIADEVYFVANLDYPEKYQDLLDRGFDAITMAPWTRINKMIQIHNSILHRILRKLHIGKNKPCRYIYNDSSSILDYHIDGKETTIPFLLPRWDHTPRSGCNGYLIEGLTPEKFADQVQGVLDIVEKKENKIIMLKSWNEWAEGNYMEPDMEFGKSYILSLSRINR